MSENKPELSEEDLEVTRLEAEEYAEEYASLLEDKRGTYSVAQVRQQMAALETLYTRGVGAAKIEAFMRRKFRVTRKRVQVLLERIRARWLQEDVDERPAERSKQIRRVYNELEMAMEDRDHAAINRCERLLSEIFGTRAPLQVDVNVRESVERVLMDLTGDEAAQMLEEYMQMEQLARANAPLLLAKSNGEGEVH